MTKATLQDEWGNYTAIPNEFIQASNDLSNHARWLFVLLRFYTNGETKTAFPSYDTIKQKTGWAYNTIAKAVRELEQNGWLSRQKQFSGNTHYVLLRRQNATDSQSLPETSNAQSLRATRTSPKQGPVLASGKPTNTDFTKTERERETREAESSPSAKLTLVSSVSAPTPPEQPFSPNDDFRGAPPAQEWTIAERFVLKSCGLWDDLNNCEKPIVETNWKTKQAVVSAGRFVAPRLDVKARIGGTPKLFLEYWHDEIKRTATPRPEYVVEQWEAYDRWLIYNHETHRRLAA